MSAAGDTLAVGCTGYRSEQGAVYVFSRGAAGAWGSSQRLVADAPRDFGFFG